MSLTNDLRGAENIRQEVRTALCWGFSGAMSNLLALSRNGGMYQMCFEAVRSL